MDLGAQLAKASGTIVEWASSRVLAAVGSAAHGLLNLIIALFGLYFLLESGAHVWERTKRYLPFSDRNADALHARFVSVTQATILGLAATASSTAGLSGSGLPFRLPPSLVITSTASASSMRERSASAENPPNTTECTAPMRAQASIATAASAIIGR